MPALPQWLTPEIRGLLGHVIDRQVAERVGCSVSHVATVRRRLGIPSLRQRHLQLPPEVQAKLGTLSDAAVARASGIGVGTIRHARLALGIPKHSTLPWLTPSVQARMGTVTDQVLADELGLSRRTVWKHRVRLGIPSTHDVPESLVATVVPSLGVVPDTVLAKHTGASLTLLSQLRTQRGIAPAPRVRELTEDQVAQLGQASDAALAAEFGMASGALGKARRERGIPSFTERNRQRRAAAAAARQAAQDAADAAVKGSCWLNAATRALLGVHPDAAVAKRLKKPVDEVRQVRLGLGLPDPLQRWPWLTLEVYELLGVRPDSEVAQHAARTPAVVGAARRAMDIGPAPRRGVDTWLTPEVQALLGVWTDREVGEKVGRTFSTVASVRRSLGIPSPRSDKLWLTSEVKSQLGTVEDSVLATRLGVSAPQLRAARGSLGIDTYVPPTHAKAWLTPQVMARMGWERDQDLEGELGLPPKTVSAVRRRLGILSWRYRQEDREVPPSFLEHLATTSDAVLMKKWVVGKQFLTELREQEQVPEPDPERVGATAEHTERPAKAPQQRGVLEPPQDVPSPPPLADPTHEDVERLVTELTQSPRMARELVGALQWDRHRVDQTIRQAKQAGRIVCRGKRWGPTTPEAAAGDGAPVSVEGDAADLERLIDALAAQDGAATRDLSRQLGWKLSRTGALLREARNLGLVQREGHGAGARWYLT